MPGFLHCVVVNIVIVVVELNNCRKCQVCHHHTVDGDDDDCHHVDDDGNDALMKKDSSLFCHQGILQRG